MSDILMNLDSTNTDAQVALVCAAAVEISRSANSPWQADAKVVLETATKFRDFLKESTDGTAR